MKALRQIRPLYIASFLFGATAAVVVLARHNNSGPPPSPSFVTTVHKMGFDSAEEFTAYARLADDPRKTTLDRGESELLKRLLRRGNDASWNAIDLIGRLADDDERNAFLPDVRALAAHDLADSRLKVMMDGWKARGGAAYVARLAADPKEPLAKAAAASVAGHKNDADH